MVDNTDDVIRLYEGVQNQLEYDWKRFRDQHHNPSNKGTSYEDAFADFLRKYFQGVYDIQTQSAIIDEDLEVFDIFDTSKGENEIDIVAQFESARPKIVFEVEDMTYTPLKGVAFICEVKSQVDSDRLKSDLSKLNKLGNLIEEEDSRWGVAQTGNYTTGRQIRCLIYDQSSISEERLLTTLEESSEWDLVLIVEDNRILMNSTLPLYQDTQASVDDIMTDLGKHPHVDEEEYQTLEVWLESATYDVYSAHGGLMRFLVFLSGSIPRPLGVDSLDTFTNLLQLSRQMNIMQEVEDIEDSN